MGRAPQRTSCSPGWRLHNLPRAEEQLCPQLHNSVLFNGAPEAEAEPAPRPKIQAPLGGSCKAPCSVMCPTAVSRRLLRAGMQLKPWQVLALSKAGMHSMDHPGHSPSPAQGRGPQEGIPQVPHRGQVLRGYACGIGRSPTGALGFKAQPLQPLSLKPRWQIGRNVAVKHLIQSLAHPNPKVRGSISCSVGFPETPRG